MAGDVSAVVEPDRPGDIPLVVVTVTGGEVRFLKVRIDFASGNT